jgi:hypothetical protein
VGAGREACIAIPSAITGETIANSFWIRDEPLPCPNPLAGAVFEDNRTFGAYVARYWGTSDDQPDGFFYFGDPYYAYVHDKTDGSLVSSYYASSVPFGYRAEAYDDGTNTQIFGITYNYASGSNITRIGRAIYNRSTNSWGSNNNWLRVPSFSTTVSTYSSGIAVWNGNAYFSTYEYSGVQVYRGPIACATATSGTPCDMTKWLPIGGGTGTLLTSVGYVMGMSVDNDNAYFLHYNSSGAPYYRVTRYNLTSGTTTMLGSVPGYMYQYYQQSSQDNPDADSNGLIDWFWYHDYYGTANGATYDGKIKYVCNPGGSFSFFGNASDFAFDYFYITPITYDNANKRLGTFQYSYVNSGPVIFE